MDTTFETPAFDFTGAEADTAEQILQAASLAQNILKHCKSTPSWAALMVSLEREKSEADDRARRTRFDSLVIDEDQWSLLEDQAVIVHAVGLKPSQTVIACGECGEWMILGEGSAPSRCPMTGSCLRTGGELLKAKGTLAKRKPNSHTP
jgi:hypothetical protein